LTNYGMTRAQVANLYGASSLRRARRSCAKSQERGEIVQTMIYLLARGWRLKLKFSRLVREDVQSCRSLILEQI
jgi:hypothetical protein